MLNRFFKEKSASLWTVQCEISCRHGTTLRFAALRQTFTLSCVNFSVLRPKYALWVNWLMRSLFLKVSVAVCTLRSNGNCKSTVWDLSISRNLKLSLRISETQRRTNRNLLPLFVGWDSEVTDVRFLRKIDSFVPLWTSTQSGSP
jgi:hypothetical protein